jgi:hypothetical protein
MFDFFHVVDDKCGSFWCELPVVENGRDSKALAGNKYSFSVQANVMRSETFGMRQILSLHNAHVHTCPHAHMHTCSHAHMR